MAERRRPRRRVRGSAVADAASAVTEALAAAGDPTPPAAAAVVGVPEACAGSPTDAAALDRTGGRPGDSRQHVAIVTGVSGAGKTATSKLFEDLGYTVVDNLPAELLRDLAELVAHQPDRFRRVALVLDVRAGDPATAFEQAISALQSRGIRPQVFFLEARDDVLIRRFSETRHRHPLDTSHQGLVASLVKERRLLDPVRSRADIVIDTSSLSGRELREHIYGALPVDGETDELSLRVISFGYKYGIPLEADVVFDVRFMENPFYKDDLRPLSGLTEPVRTFVLGQPVTQQFLEFAKQFFGFAIPAYRREGKTRLTVGIGCTGGYHRSIAIAEALAAAWRSEGLGPVSVWHRELHRA